MLRTFDQHVPAEFTQIAMPQVEHIGIAVLNVDEALRIFRDVLGESPYKTETIEKDGIRTHFIRGGGAKLELLEALRPDSAISGYLEKRGGGLHHVAIEVDDLRAALERLQALGYDPIDREPRPGADGKMIAFLHPKQTAGILIELCESRQTLLGEALGEDAQSDRPVLLILGDAAAAEPYARRLEQSCRVVIVEELSDFDLEEPLHVLAFDSYIESALAAAAEHPSTIRSLALILSQSAGSRASKPACPVLIVAEDGEGPLNGALTLRARIGGSLAVFPSDRRDLSVDAVDGFLRSAIRRSPRP